MNKYKNFDEFFAAQEKKKDIKLVMFGKEYELSKELPATLFLKIFRSMKGEEELGQFEQLNLAMQVLGEKNVEEWCEKGLTMQQLSEIINWVTDQILLREEGEEEGKKQRTS